MQPITVNAKGIAASADGVALSQSVEAAMDLALEALAADFGTPSQVLITTNADYSSVVFTITGTDANGAIISETITGPNAGTANSVLYYASVTSISASGGVEGGLVEAGLTGTVTSRWVRMDSWAHAQTVAQVSVSGSITYTVETSMDDPNDPVAPVAAIDMVWLDAEDADLVAETASKSGAFAYTPTWIRVKGSTGTGTASLKVAQFGNATY